MGSIIKTTVIAILIIICAASSITFATYFGKVPLISTLAFVFSGLSWEAIKVVIGLDIKVESTE